MKGNIVKIKTFNQYMLEVRENIRIKYDLTRAEAIQEVPESAYWADWRAYVVEAYNDGADVPTRFWRSLDEGLQYRILRSPRALKSDAETRALTAKTL